MHPGERFTLEPTPNPQGYLELLEILLPIHETRNLISERQAEAAEQYSGTDLEEELEFIKEELPEPDSEFSDEVAEIMLQRDVAGFHIQNPNSLQMKLRERADEYKILLDRWGSTFESVSGNTEDIRQKTDHKSRRIRSLANEKWRRILHEVAELNGWSFKAYEIELPEAIGLEARVTDGSATVIIYPDLLTGYRSPISEFPIYEYGLDMSHLRKYSYLTEGSALTESSFEDLKTIIELETGEIVNLTRIPTLEELTFYEKVLAAYY